MGMGAVAATRDDEEAKKMEAGDDTVGQKLDAGALFVLQSKGDLINYRGASSVLAIFSVLHAKRMHVCLPTCNHACIFVFLEHQQASR